MDQTAAVVTLPEPGDLFAGNALSRLGHELRGPLTGIIGLTGLMTRKAATGAVDQAQQTRQLQMINSSAAELLGTVERIVALAHSAAPADERRLEPVDCVAVTADAVAATGETAAARNRHVIVRTPPGPVRALAHPDDARQVVTELLANAVRYADHPDIHVTVRPGGAATGPAVEIADHGPGLSPAEQQRVFLPFERGAAAHDHDEHGTGLGLCLAQHLTRRCGATLTVRTSPAGTICTVVFQPGPGAEKP
ncbi:sensor histidine kinase [Actinoplanes flavus]|uniref:histidine kinase n=1 Tax=Actinoplanes flavus TaxID=2820290 RepID=A0ABS3UNS5_9ACTN|nr:HAMP domain-containing sensor histidine kinase [Actinoplanes flavus]MBO3740126.1 HAMP domain-containing histidine kinase [Actinoplanes flavus]